MFICHEETLVFIFQAIALFALSQRFSAICFFIISFLHTPQMKSWEQKAPARQNKVFIDIETSLYKLSAEMSHQPNGRSFTYTSYHYLTGNLGLSRGVCTCEHLRIRALPHTQQWKNKPFVIMSQTFKIISTCSCHVKILIARALRLIFTFTLLRAHDCAVSRTSVSPRSQLTQSDLRRA